MSAKRIVKIASWSLYDLAVKFFTLNIVSLHFVRWLTIKRGMPDIYYSLAFGASMLVVVLFSPVIGKISDISGRKKLILTVFTLTTACLIGLLGFTYNLGVALVLFAFANLFLQLAVIIYNSLITAVAPVKKMGFVSGFGKMFGFIGAIGILYLMKPIVINYGYHPLFFVSGVLLFLFSLPCIIFIEGKSKESYSLAKIISLQLFVQTFKSLLSSFKKLQQISGVKNLLKASFFILCPVNVLILFMAVYLTKVFGLQEAGLVNVLAIAAVFAIFGSIIFGTISDYLGYKNTIYFISSMLFSGFILIALFTAKIHAFWLAGLFGLIYGALMAVPRALAVSLVPDKKIGELFGFLAVIGYLAGIVGPLFWGLMLLILRPLGVLRYRIVIVSLVLFIIPALYYFIRIPKRKLQHEQ